MNDYWKICYKRYDIETQKFIVMECVVEDEALEAVLSSIVYHYPLVSVKKEINHEQ